MQADAVPIKYRIAGKPLLSCSNHVGEIEQQTIRAMLLDGRQAASDLQGMNGKTDSDQFAAESERVSLADFSGQEHRWNCPKANRIDDTNDNRNGCMQLSFQSTRKCLKTIPVQQKDRRWRILRCARKNTAVQIICIGGIFMTLSLLVRQSYYYGTADSGIVSVLSACIFETVE